MYLDFKVKIPSDSAGVTRKKIKGVTYVYYVYEHNYNPEKGYTVPKSTSIGKCADDDAEMMYPNTNFLKFFPAEELPETKGEAYRSGCMRVGTYLVLRRIISEYHLDEMLGDIIGKDSGLFLDLAVYSADCHPKRPPVPYYPASVSHIIRPAINHYSTVLLT